MKRSDLADRVIALKEKWPAYGPLLDFYFAVRKAQASARPNTSVPPDRVAEFFADELTVPACARIGRLGFPIDVDDSIGLFTDLCRLGAAANPHFAAAVEKIKQVISSGEMNLHTMLQQGVDEGVIAQAAVDHHLDARALSFLVTNSIRPSIDLSREQLVVGFQPDTWRKTCCPVCGSAPTLSLLKGDPVFRFSLCSHCGCQWPVDRLSCSSCGNRNPDTRSYFQPEDETSSRIDLCDECRRYIKTIDMRRLKSPDPVLEDLASLHLDLVAVEKGYLRIVPNSWCE